MAGFRKLITIDRDDDDAPSLLKRFSAYGRGPMHDHLRALYDDNARGKPHQTSAANFADAWNSLSGAERDAVRAEEAMAERERAREAARRKETQKMDTPTQILADYGAPAVAKCIVDEGRTSVFGEHALTKAITDYAMSDRRQGESEAQAFTRIYTADDENGRLFRSAMKIVNGSPPKHAAYDLLMEKAREVRRTDPKLSEAQAFTKIYCAPENSALVAFQKLEQTS